MGKKIPRDNGKRTKKQEHRVARATRRGVLAAPRAMPLHFPEQAQHLVCELLCELRLAELDADDDERSRLERYKRSPHKLSGRVRLNLCREAKGGKGGGAKLLVVERSDDVDVLLKKAKKLLSTKREPKFAYEEATGLELRDTRTIENDTRVCVADAARRRAAAAAGEAAGVKLVVVVTQPRRVAAVALAERVAAERGEACRLGDGDVGYSVRLERRGSSRTRLEFCTVGVLLRRLQRGGPLDATHVVVDEAHERDVLTDFLLVVLKTRVLPACPGLKVVVMSATLNAALFGLLRRRGGVGYPGRLHDVAARSLGDGAWVLPMHGGLTSRDQHRVFQRPPPGARKVVVATNVAETSITIDDVDCVVDLGRVKELRYRAGRAGRVRAGACYRLYPRKLHDEGLPAHTAPEMLRTPLADAVLKVLRLGFGGPKAFLARALQPPRPESVDAALRDLVAVGAVAGGAPPEEVREASDDDDDDEAPEQDGDLFSLGAGVQGLLMGDSSDDSDGDDDGAAPADDGEAWVLTPRRHVADLPMDCRVAKLLIYGAIFGAAEPCLTLAAGMSLPKGVFVAPFHKRKEAAAAKRRFARGSESDLLAVVGAYEARGALDRRDVPGFCRDHFLHMAALGDLTGLRNQFRGHLRDAGLLGDEEAVTLDETSSLLRGLLCAGLYPHVARLAGDAPHLKCRDRSKWWCHPQSLNFKTLAPGGKLKERKTTYVSLDGTRVVLDGWLPFKATKHAQLAVLALRGEIDALLAAAVDADARARPAAEAQRRLVVAAVRNLLAMLTPS
ncbi:helicase [Aureococcus anophagefferens]|nr:helicase [Aureococcus anophagefferens]